MANDYKGAKIAWNAEKIYRLLKQIYKIQLAIDVMLYESKLSI